MVSWWNSRFLEEKNREIKTVWKKNFKKRVKSRHYLNSVIGMAMTKDLQKGQMPSACKNLKNIGHAKD